MKIRKTNHTLFKEHDFITTLLFLMYQKGVTQIEEKKLTQKLYYYYLSREYNELFQDINCTLGILDQKININRGLYKERILGHIFTEPLDHQKQNLVYDPTRDISPHEKNLSEEGKKKIRKMSEELAIMDEIERKSPHKLCIYKTSPNHLYTLVSGMISSQPFYFHLITDGQTHTMKNIKLQSDPNFYKDPLDFHKYTRIESPFHQLLSISDATYSMTQAIYQDSVCYSAIETEIIEKDHLQQIANHAHPISEKQYIKK